MFNDGYGRYHGYILLNFAHNIIQLFLEWISIIVLVSRQERRYVWKSKKVWSYTRGVWLYGPRFMYYCTIVPAVLSGVSLVAERLYICIPILFVVSQNIMGTIPHLWHDLAEGWITNLRFQVCFKNIVYYLCLVGASYLI